MYQYQFEIAPVDGKRKYINKSGFKTKAEEEIAMLIDEPVNNVRLLINVLIKTGAIERLDDNSLYLLSLQTLIGSEGSSADRVRRFRERQKELQCNEKMLLESSSENEKQGEEDK